MSTQLLEEPGVEVEATTETEPAPEVTPEQLLAMEAGHRYELIDGKLVERPMSIQSSEVGMNVMGLLRDHVRPNKLGKLYGADCGYQCFPHAPKRVRYPDGSFMAQGSLVTGRSLKGHSGVPPDLAVEVVSPNDTAEEIEARRRDFLRAGAKLFWVVYPENRTVHVFRQDGTSAVFTENDELHGDSVLPGFTCKVAELFEGI